jgi:ABC-2 type transport system permease protein
MNLKRIGILLEREIVRGPKNMIFLFAIVVPIVLTLIINLVFGTFFSGKPRMGITDLGESQFVILARALDGVVLKEYSTESELKRAVARGAVDFGMVLPAGFDQNLSQGDEIKVQGYIWGESKLKDRAILGTSVAVLLREMLGQEAPVEIETTTLGEGKSISWQERLMPLVVLMAVLLGGMMVPATSLVDEKQKHTLTALTITPATMSEVFVAKGLLGVLLSILMSTLTLLLNQSFGTQPLTLFVLLVLGAVMAACIGVLLGAFVKDINTLFATIKSFGIILYAPAIIFMFPEIPQWIGRFFPTYYLIAPIMEITQNNGTWSDIIIDVVILVALIALLFFGIGMVGRRMQTQEAV